MSIDAETRDLAERLLGELEVPGIVAVHLPDLAPDDDFRDEFGFVFLEDGIAAPFYVSLPGTLQALHAQFPDPGSARLELRAALGGLGTSSLPARALAIGAWNALGQHLLRRADFHFPPRGSGGEEPQAGERVGMVGYFCPLVDRLVERGVSVLVVEQQPERVPPRDGVELGTRLDALADCRRVYCTASTLINDTLDEVLQSCGRASSVDLIGPSGSGLPDVLFGHGVRAVGGVTFADSDALRATLEQRLSWGGVGEKYELTAQSYPGVDALLTAAGVRSSPP